MISVSHFVFNLFIFPIHFYPTSCSTSQHRHCLSQTIYIFHLVWCEHFYTHNNYFRLQKKVLKSLLISSLWTDAYAFFLLLRTVFTSAEFRRKTRCALCTYICSKLVAKTKKGAFKNNVLHLLHTMRWRETNLLFFCGLMFSFLVFFLMGAGTK